LIPINAEPPRPATMMAVMHAFKAQGAASTSPRSQAARAHGQPPEPEAGFLIELGRRLREARLALAMSRRELARRSGISERYIAEIEAGRGNVSIVLLLRIIRAVRET
jgi:DNA-binding XRE family transcriptional regulator